MQNWETQFLTFELGRDGLDDREGWFWLTEAYAWKVAWFGTLPPRELDDQLTAVLGDGDPEYEKCMEDGEDEERDEPACLFN